MEGVLALDILIAEDEPGILESLEFIFKRAGWSVSSVTDGELVLEKIAKLQPKVLVLDVMLPKKSGFEVLKQLRLKEITKNLPVLILTAKGQKQDRIQAQELGASAFITKPYANEDVVDGVRQLLNLAKFTKQQKQNNLKE